MIHQGLLLLGDMKWKIISLLVTIIILPINQIQAIDINENYFCESYTNWTVRNGSSFIFTRFAQFTLPTEIEGYISAGPKKRISGIFVFPNDSVILLTGRAKFDVNKNNTKKFIENSKNIDPIIFYPSDKSPSKQVYTGRLKADDLYSYEGYRLKLNNREPITCTRLNDKLVSNIMDNVDPEGLTLLTPPPKIKDTIIPENERKITSVLPPLPTVKSKSLSEITKKTNISETLKENNNPRFSTAPSLSMTHPSKSICSITGEPLSIEIETKKYQPPFTVYGHLRKNIIADSFWHDPDISNDFIQNDFKVDLSEIKSKYTPIIMSYLEIFSGKSTDIIPVILENEKNIKIANIDGIDNNKNPVFKILLVGDSPSISISGLHKSDDLIKGNISIDWYEIDQRGNLVNPETHNNFDSIIKSSRLKDTKKVLLQSENDFKNMIDNLLNLMKEANDYKYVIWVKEGYQLPLITPEYFYQFIQEVHRSNVIFNPALDRPYDWLYILSGYMPGGSRTLLEEALNRSTPINPGDIDEEKPSISTEKTRSLLFDPKKLSLNLKLAMRSFDNTFIKAVTNETNLKNIAFKATEIFDNYSILVKVYEMTPKIGTKESYSQKTRQAIRYLNKKLPRIVDKTCSYILVRREDTKSLYFDRYFK